MSNLLYRALCEQCPHHLIPIPTSLRLGVRIKPCSKDFKQILTFVPYNLSINFEPSIKSLRFCLHEFGVLHDRYKRGLYDAGEVCSILP